MRILLILFFILLSCTSAEDPLNEGENCDKGDKCLPRQERDVRSSPINSFQEIRQLIPNKKVKVKATAVNGRSVEMDACEMDNVSIFYANGQFDHIENEPCQAGQDDYVGLYELKLINNRIWLETVEQNEEYRMEIISYSKSSATLRQTIEQNIVTVRISLERF